MKFYVYKNFWLGSDYGKPCYGLWFKYRNYRRVKIFKLCVLNYIFELSFKKDK